MVAIIVVILPLTIGGPVLAAGSGKNPSFIRDAEIENGIRTMATPIFVAAGIDPDSVQIAIINEAQVNAFVAGGQNLFLYTGLLRRTENASELIGVIAHETGHIAGGHLIRGHDAMAEASVEAIVAMVLGVGAAVLSGNTNAGIATALSGQEFARRSLLAFSRGQESAADQAALSYLDNVGWSAAGMAAFLDKLADQELMPADRRVEYIRTHPLTRDRVEAVQRALDRSPNRNHPVPEAFEQLHRRIRAKLDGFIQPAAALRRYSPNDPDLVARYARAIALYRQGTIKEALPAIDNLIAAEPNNPFFHELKGQVLLENRRVSDAIAPYRRAVELLPRSGLLRLSLAQAYLESGQPGLVDAAARELDAARHQESRSSHLWRLMAEAWGRKGNQGMTAYALAEEALARGDPRLALAQSTRAERMLPKGSPGWLRSQDIKAVAESMIAHED